MGVQNLILSFILTEYSQILPETKPKILKLKFPLVTNKIFTVVHRILGDRLASEVTVLRTYTVFCVVTITVISFHNQHH